MVDAIARRLGWGFVTIDTSAFLASGLSNVAGQITHIFEQLMQLQARSRPISTDLARGPARPSPRGLLDLRRPRPRQEVVVLFDEVEEFVLDRSNPQLGMESRMLTTAMLTKLADLRGRRKVVFFIATNRLAALDAAVTRPGRFDLQLFVGTPNLRARVGRMRARLAAALQACDEQACGAEEESGGEQVLMEAFEAVLSSRWDATARYMTFLETEKLAADSIALYMTARTQPQLAQPELEEAIERLLSAQAAVMTVRGSVRDDFDSSMGMSRT